MNYNSLISAVVRLPWCTKKVAWTSGQDSF